MEGAHDHSTSDNGAHSHSITVSGVHWHTVDITINVGLTNVVNAVGATDQSGDHTHTVGNSDYQGAHVHTNPSTGGPSATTLFMIDTVNGTPCASGSCVAGIETSSGATGSHTHAQGSTGSEGGHTHAIPNTSYELTHGHLNPNVTTIPMVDSVQNPSGVTTSQHNGHDHPESTELDHNHVITISIEHAHTVPNTSTGPTHVHTVPDTSTGPTHAHTVPNTSTGPTHVHTVPNTSTGPTHVHTVPNTSTGPTHAHVVPNSATEPAHEHTIPDSSYTPPYVFPLEYGLYEEGAGDALELFINGELVGNYVGAQSSLNVTGWIHTGNNSVILQPIVSDNVKGRAKISAIATIFVENLK